MDKVSTRGPYTALEQPQGPTSTCWLPAVPPPVWLVQRTGRPCPRGQALGSPAPSHYLMEFLIVHLCPVQLRRMRSMPARPRFSTSRQRPVPLFMMAPFWEEMRQGGGGETEGREREKLNYHSARYMASWGEIPPKFFAQGEGRVTGASSGNSKVRK